MTITPADIAACESERLLRSWHNRYYEEKDRLASEREGAQIVGYAHGVWLKMMGKRIGNCIQQLKRIERRILELGFAPILTRKTGHQRIIKDLMAENDRLKAELAALEMV
jgi:hypothetical protein